MPLEAADKRRKSRTNRTGSAASKVRLLTMSDLDRRTAASKHALATKDAITADLGGEDQLSTLERLQVENAALDAAVLRDMQARWLMGQDISLGDMIALENVFNRTAAALGTTRRPKDVSPALTDLMIDVETT